MKQLSMRVADQHAGQLPVCPPTHFHLSRALPLTGQLHFPNSPVLWLPDTFSHERVKVGRGEKLRCFPFLCFLEDLLQGSSRTLSSKPPVGSLVLSVSLREAPLLGSVTPLSGSLRSVDDVHLSQF